MSKLSRRTFLASTAGWMAVAACSTSQEELTPSSTATPQPEPEPASGFELARFLEDLKQARPEGQSAVEAVIAQAVSDPAGVIRELGVPGGRDAAVLYQGDGLSVYNIVFPPSAIIGAHQHTTWATIGVYAGREENVVFQRVNDELEETREVTVDTGEIFSLPDAAIHSVTNPHEISTAAIHVYGADLSAP